MHNLGLESEIYDTPIIPCTFNRTMNAVIT